MESITIGASPIGLKIKKNPLKIMIGGSGGAPAPPTPSDTFPSITDDFHRVEENMLMGTVTDEWEFAADSSEDFISVPNAIKEV